MLHMKDIHDIKQVILISYDYLPIIIVLSTMLFLFFILMYISIRKKIVKKKLNKTEYLQFEKLSAKEIALNELKILKKDNLIEANRQKLFYERISQIIKNYLKEQYNIEIDSRTSREIICQLKNMQFDYNLVKHIEICLNNFDFAKYSFYKISHKDMYLSLENAFILFKLEELEKNK